MLTPLFQEKDTEIDAKEYNNEFHVFVNWYLHTDKDNKIKRSRRIEIVFGDVVIEDYLSEIKNQEDFDRKLHKYIRNKLNNFNPEHDTPRESPRPIESWTIATLLEILNS